jgi:flavodoxin
MNIEYYQASKYGNGAKVAEELKKQLESRENTVNIHHVKKSRPQEIPHADLYIFSSPGRFGKPISDMQHFLKKIKLPSGTRYAIIATELCPNPEGVKRITTEEEIGKCQHIIPIMNQLLQEKGLVKVAETKIFVTGLKGPLEKEWQKVVEVFASQIPAQPNVFTDRTSNNYQLASVA